MNINTIQQMQPDNTVEHLKPGVEMEKILLYLKTVGITTILLIVQLPFLGCGTIITTAVLPSYMEKGNPTSTEKRDWQEEPWIYSGTYFDYKCFYHPEYRGTNNVELLCLIDLPLSLAADTLILPVTIPLQIYNNKGKAPAFVTEKYKTYEEAIKATNGWIPAFVPHSAKNIVLADDPKTNQRWMHFHADTESLKSMTQNLEIVPLETFIKGKDFKKPEWPFEPDLSYIVYGVHADFFQGFRACSASDCICIVVRSLRDEAFVWTCNK
jgi:uncharacterized protein YceK